MRYEDQSVNTVQGNNRCLFRESYKKLSALGSVFYLLPRVVYMITDVLQKFKQREKYLSTRVYSDCYCPGLVFLICTEWRTKLLFNVGS